MSTLRDADRIYGHKLAVATKDHKVVADIHTELVIVGVHFRFAVIPRIQIHLNPVIQIDVGVMTGLSNFSEQMTVINNKREIEILVVPISCHLNSISRQRFLDSCEVETLFARITAKLLYFGLGTQNRKTVFENRREHIAQIASGSYADTNTRRRFARPPGCPRIAF